MLMTIRYLSGTSNTEKPYRAFKVFSDFNRFIIAHSIGQETPLTGRA